MQNFLWAVSFVMVMLGITAAPITAEAAQTTLEKNGQAKPSGEGANISRFNPRCDAVESINLICLLSGKGFDKSASNKVKIRSHSDKTVSDDVKADALHCD